MAVEPGARVVVRGDRWMVKRVERDGACRQLHCIGLAGIAKGKEAIFVDRLEGDDLKVLDPVKVALIADQSSGYLDTKLYLEAALRSTPPQGDASQVLGQAAIDDLPFQHEPVLRALKQPRIRLLMADDVGLGKTLQAGLVAAELAVRKRANRILVVTTRAMLVQFQKEFWTRFSIPLARLDSAAIRRMRNSIPANYNVFDQFDRAIVSVDTLKKDSQYRLALEQSKWDLIIIDEAHNVADRKASSGNKNLRARLASLLARQTDALLLLTATPHDGSARSFSSLIRMLDETRVPNPAELKRDDIEDLVVRRFRASLEVVRDIRKKVPARSVVRRSFSLDPLEDAALQSIADLKLDMDEKPGGKARAIDLFRTTLAKSAFSSPAACIETIENRLRRIASGQARGSDRDVSSLKQVRDAFSAVTPDIYQKYAELLKLLKDIKWTGRDKRDRLVIFSERIATLRWLQERLASDLGLGADAVAAVDGSQSESDEAIQKALEDFGQENASIRILLASDIASEGLNLHFQCHRLIHFDLPWSLLRFQQRNGRIDRYGQDRQPQIYYFIGESSHPRVRDMWVLEKLVEKDEAAQLGISDPAVFLGVGDADEEETVVAEAVSSGAGAEAFGRAMDANAEKKTADVTDEWALLMGAYGEAPSGAPAPEPRAARAARLFPDTFSFAAAMLERQAEEDAAPKVDLDARTLEFKLPDDLRATDSFGYANSRQVDPQYMPAEAVGRGERIELTDNKDVIDAAIQRARGDERAWPTVQYLWDAHPLMDWLNDRAAGIFPAGEVPLLRPAKGLQKGEAAVLLHGAISSRSGRVQIDRWGVVMLRQGKAAGVQDDVGAFLESIGFYDETPNAGVAIENNAINLQAAVDTFQAHLNALRKVRQQELSQLERDIEQRLAPFRARFEQQLEMDFTTSASDSAALQKRKQNQKQRRETEVRALFSNWEAWIADNCVLPEEPHPFVDIKAVFWG
jgi:superfamily II DNA or RNA helicase